MRIDILTLFPGMFLGPLTESMLKRATEKRLLDIRIHDIREFADGRHKQADDAPYGGGAGMVMMAEPIVKTMEKLTGGRGDPTSLSLRRARLPSGQGYGRQARLRGTGQKDQGGKPWRIYLSPVGRRLTQVRVEKLGREHDWLILLCGHYEGVDQRVVDGWIDEEISIGDFVLTGGELPAMVLIDALARQIPGVLGKGESAEEESFSKRLKRRREYPHYTRPEEFRGMHVPEVLLSGDHKKITEWRRSKLR